jgi:hypothetical protein
VPRIARVSRPGGLPKSAKRHGRQGTPEDWRRIRERVEVLETFDLGWWVPRLRPILDEFVRTAEGNPDRDFWKAIYKPEEVYGGEVVNGWLIDLFPYLRDAPIRVSNPTLKIARTHWMLPLKHGLPPSCFGLGLSRVPVKLNLQDGSSNNVELLAGFAGVGQSAEDLALFPMINWCVAKSEAQSEIGVRGAVSRTQRGMRRLRSVLPRCSRPGDAH